MNDGGRRGGGSWSRDNGAGEGAGDGEIGREGERIRQKHTRRRLQKRCCRRRNCGGSGAYGAHLLKTLEEIWTVGSGSEWDIGKI